MDYEKKYKELAAKIKNAYLYAQTDSTKTVLEDIFPELSESEDERNIKDLIDELKCSLMAANFQNDACGGGHEKRIALLEWGIAWLEKQASKTKWSEEDDYNVQSCIAKAERDIANGCHGRNKELIEWLNSIKYRVK